MDKEKSNSDKQKKSQWIWPGIIGSVVLISIVIFVCLAAIRDLSNLENVLLQFIFLLIGCYVSYRVGQKSVKQTAREMIRPYAKSAFRRLVTLYRSLSRASSVIKSEPESESDTDPQMMLAKLDMIITEQLDTAEDALEDWNDIVPEEVEELKQKLQSNNMKENEQ